MVYGYIRVSTETQDVENQKIGINVLAEQKGVIVEKWIADDGVSGTVDYHKRKLGQLMKKLKKGDMILLSELSRLARNMYMLFEILKFLTENEIQLYTVKDGYNLDGTIASKVLAFGLGLAAEIERDMISKRTKEGLEARRRVGVVLGRPIGSKSKKKKLTDKEEQIKHYLDRGLSYSAISRLMKIHRLTISNFCKENGLEQHKTMHHHPLEDEKKEKFLISMRANRNYNKHITQQVTVENDEVLQMYKDSYYSLNGLQKKLNFGNSRAMMSFLKKRGIWEKIVEMNEKQRSAVKSLRKIERETGIPRRKNQ